MTLNKSSHIIVAAILSFSLIFAAVVLSSPSDNQSSTMAIPLPNMFCDACSGTDPTQCVKAHFDVNGSMEELIVHRCAPNQLCSNEDGGEAKCAGMVP
ncbi:hypothetical protein H4219_006236 [Mycoemilia scoparia]|uniref:Uncharacterized protein n=1 Tax=Mycoemilia scoparia TaxID=417184 RepID=A0A9W7ZPS9_9FUNG|nr:hypothetical protein H4219_006236 [Mycoemilia scoparia]